MFEKARKENKIVGGIKQHENDQNGVKGEAGGVTFFK